MNFYLVPCPLTLDDLERSNQGHRNFMANNSRMLEQIMLKFSPVAQRASERDPIAFHHPASKMAAILLKFNFGQHFGPIDINGG